MTVLVTHHRGLAVVAAAGLALAATGCDWDRYDPRLAADAGTPVSNTLCGRINALSDDFEDGELGRWWSSYSYYGSDTESGGQLQLTSGVAYGSIISARFYDFREGSVAVEVTSVADPATNVRTELQVRRHDYHVLAIRQEGDALIFLKSVNGTVELGRTAWDAMAHRWWRIRHHDESVYWETSPDGSSWSTHAEEELNGLFDLDYVRVRLASFANGADPGSSASFDNVTTTGPGDGTWCPSHILRDDFSNDELADQWLHSWGEEGITGIRYDDQLVVSLVPGLPEESGYAHVPSRFHDLTGDMMFLEVVQLPNPPAEVYLRASQGPDVIDLRLSDDQLTCHYEVEDGGATVAEEPFSPINHRWWRIRLDGQAIHWEASSDGLSWSSLALTSPNPIADLTKADLRFGVQIPPDHPDPGHARFDNFNVVPAPVH